MSADTVAIPPQSDAVRAALWMCGAIASFSLMAVAGRELAGALDTFELMLYRSLIGAVIVTAWGVAALRLPEVRTGRLRLHVLRNVVHFAGQNLWFYGLALIPLAQLFAFEFTTPIWVALLAPLVLGEAMTRGRMMAIALGFAGILVVAQPGASPFGIGQLAAAACAIGFAGTVLTTKQLARTESIWTILFWMAWMQLGLSLVTAGHDGGIALPPAGTWPWVLVVGVTGITAHLSVTSALRCAPASIVAPMDFARLPIIAVVGMLLYGEPLEVAVLAGGGLILVGNLINIRVARAGRRETR